MGIVTETRRGSAGFVRLKYLHKRIPADLRSHLLGIALVMSATLIWSTVPVGTRMLMKNGSAFSPAFISAGRLWVAAVLFILIRAVYAKRSGEPFHVPIGRPVWLLISAASLCINYLLYAIGLRYTTAGATSIVSQVNAVATVICAALLLGECITKQKVVGMVLAMSGVSLVLVHGSSLTELLASSHFHGNLIEIIGALAWPFYAVGQTKLLQNGGGRQILMPIFVVSAVLSLLMLPFTGPLIVKPPTIIDWVVLLFLGVGSTALAYWCYAAGLQHIETSTASMFGVLMPLFALLLAHWLLREPLQASALVGLTLVVGGLVLISWRRSHSPLRRRITVREKVSC